VHEARHVALAIGELRLDPRGRLGGDLELGAERLDLPGPLALRGLGAVEGRAGVEGRLALGVEEPLELLQPVGEQGRLGAQPLRGRLRGGARGPRLLALDLRRLPGPVLLREIVTTTEGQAICSGAY